MKSIKLPFILIVSFLPLITGLLHRCPEKETIAPFCTCWQNSHTTDVQITCKEIRTSFDLQETLYLLQNYVVDKLVIQESGTFELTSGTFRKLTIHAINFREVVFQKLPVLTFLDGVHDTIEEVQFLGCKVSHWIWHKGTHFAFLRTMLFTTTAFPKQMTNDTFAAFPNNVRHLRLNSAGIEKLGSNALRKFGHLEKFEIPNNELTTLERSTFPDPANRLRHLSFMNNPLKFLPPDAFVRMRRLEILFLSATLLRTLDQNTFMPVWDQLEEVYLNNIYIDCDCNSTWLLEVPNKRSYRPPFCKGHQKPTLVTEVEPNKICPNYV